MGFPLADVFSAHKFRLHMEIDNTSESNDRTGQIHLRRCGNLLSKPTSNQEDPNREFETYMELYETMQQAIQPPDLMIYLRCSVRTIKKRIKQRGRASEQDLDTKYIRNLNKLYEDWIGLYSLSPVLIWDSDNMDYIADLVHRHRNRDNQSSSIPDAKYCRLRLGKDFYENLAQKWKLQD